MSVKKRGIVAVFCVMAMFSSFLLPAADVVQAASARPAQSAAGMVVSTHVIADEIGTKVLSNGGNAIDAAVAVGYALAVVHPAAGNLGGGGFAVIHTAAGESATLDFREVAPRAASRDMYLDEKGEVVPKLSTEGYLAAGVPGTVAGLSELLARYGTKPLKELIEPAIYYAERGYTVNARQAESFNGKKEVFQKFSSSKKYFLKANGDTYREGDVLVQKDLGKVLRLIANKGPDAFYQGEVADIIVKDMQANSGIITKEDLAAYRPVWREPVRGVYRGHEIISMGPSSSGGTHIIQMLNILEGYDIGKYGFGSAQAVHYMAEAMRYAYADRSEYMGDPDFVKIPLGMLTSQQYAGKIRKNIEPDKAAKSADVKPGQHLLKEGNNTTHYSVVDKWGNAVAITYTINDSYGSGAAVNGAGFLLNNEMDDFSVKPGVANLYGLVGGDANAVAPGKRPLSSMSPTIVLKDGRLFLVLGSPGGSRIITTTMQVIMNVIDHQMNIREAVEAPRVHMQWIPDELRIEQNGLSPDTINILKRMGHDVVVRPYMGDVNAIMYDAAGNVMYGSKDPRVEF